MAGTAENRGGQIKGNSFLLFAYQGVAIPVGALAGGYFASIFDVILILALTALEMLCVSVILFLHPELRKLPTAKEIGPKTFCLLTGDAAEV